MFTFVDNKSDVSRLSEIQHFNDTISISILVVHSSLKTSFNSIKTKRQTEDVFLKGTMGLIYCGLIPIVFSNLLK